MEQLEDRLAPAGNIIATVAGSYPQHLFREYTPTGSLVRSVVVPPTPGNTFDYARGVVEDPSGKVYVYDGTFTPYLATFSPTASTWSQTTYTGWSTVSNVSYGGLGLYHNFVYASDMNTAGAAPNGVVRFDTVANTATRFGNGIDFTKVTIGLDNKVYALAGQQVYVYDPVAMTQLRVITLPSGDYRGIAVNASGDIFTTAWNSVISHFNSSGTLLQSITLNSSNGAPFMFSNPDDIAIASDGTLAIGSFSGHIVQMTSAFTNISYIDTGTSNTVFVTFAPGSSGSAPSVSVGDVSATIGTSGTTQFQFPVTLSVPSSQTIKVNYTTADGTATLGESDYQAASGTVTFAPGQTSQTITVLVNGNTIVEPSEAFFVTLTGVIGNATLGRTTATGTIFNNNLPTLTIYNYTTTEGNSGTTPFTFTVYLSAAVSQTVTVNYATADGTATTAKGDYQASSGTLTFAPGQTSQTITVYVNGNTVDEPDETFYVNLSNPVNATIAGGQGRGTILNDDLSISVSDTSATEANSGTTLANFTVNLSAASTHSVTVGYYTSGGTGTAGTDYTSVNGTITFNPGQTTATVTVPVIGDTIYDGNEMFNLYLCQPANAILSRGQGVGTIIENAPSAISVNDVSVVSPTSGTVSAFFTVSLSAVSSTALSVNFATANGTATAGSDYTAVSGTLTFAPGQISQTVAVPVNGDPLYDANEAFTITLSNPSVGATLGKSQGTATIVSSQPQPGLSVADVSVVDGVSGTTPINFTVTLSNPSGDPVTVNYATANGTATAGSDYQAASGTVTFAPGQTNQTVPVYAIGDPLYDASETFILNLSGPVNATLARSQATATIVSGVPVPSLSINNVSVNQSSTTAVPATFTVTLSVACNEPVTVAYATADNTALAGDDYQATSGTLTFAPGQTTQTITVQVNSETVFEYSESFLVRLSNPTNATLYWAAGTATLANSNPKPLLTVNDIAVPEGQSGLTPAVFTVNLSAPSGVDTGVYYYTTDGTAVSDGTDYNYASGYLYIPAGQTAENITVYIDGNNINEPNETFFLNLYSPMNATLARSQAMCTIINNNPNGAIELTPAIEGEALDYTGTGVFAVAFSETTNMSIRRTNNPGTGAPYDDRGLLEFNLAPIMGQQTNAVAFRLYENSVVSGSQPILIYGYVGDGVITTADATSPGVLLGSFDPTYTGWKTVLLDLTGIESLVGTTGYLGLRLVGNPNDNVVLLASPTYDAAALDFNPGTPPVLPALSVSDVSATDATQTVGALTPMNFTLSLSQPASVPVTVTYQTADGTALAGTDYVPVNGFVVFNPGDTQKTVTINIVQDGTVEPTETYTLNATGAANAALARGTGTGTIVSIYPSVTVAPASVVENNTAIVYASFTLSLSAPVQQTVTVNYATSDLVVAGPDPNSATAGIDYQATMGTATFTPGQTTATVLVPVLSGGMVEPAEQFLLGLSSPVNAVLGSTWYNYGTILNNNHAPVANAGPNQTVNEGAVVQFDGSASSDADGDPLTFTWGFGDGSGGSGVNPTHVFADNGVYTVTLSVSDGWNTSNVATTTITVLNVPPTAAVSGPADGVPGQGQMFTFTATDPSHIDQAAPFTYQITWGDGTTQTVQGPGSGVSVGHVFTAPGPYTVSTTATDKDGGTGAAASQTITIVAAELQGSDLFVGGTIGDDHITIQPADTNGTVDVVVNGQDQGTFVPTGHVIVYGQAGNDLIEVVPLVTANGNIMLSVPVVMIAGNGNNTLDARGAAGPAILSGGMGNDILWGGSGRNLLFGGGGSDVLNGGSGGNLFVGGTTSYDGNLAALLALEAEWSRTDADFLTRIAHLNGSAAGGLNGAYQLNNQTVFADAALDSLYAGPGPDWLFAASVGTNPAQIYGLLPGDVVTSL